ncbi:tRNA (guanine-N(7)-)-methyltransferase non-catalytic subunit wdr4 [Lamellibrachia satsuma]|nr:tRNA (guanine-N(7)-)-methyltransferase non-catalytic subunit wdr4 [Lamellibrachia satsuma]
MELEEVCRDRLIVTCDRDEKIRISHYPNTHSIKTFCLGHKDFVSQLHYSSKHDLLASGSGDGTLRLWNYHTGTQLCITDCRHQLVGALSRTSHDTCDTLSGQQSKGNDGCAAGADRACVRCLTCCQTRDVIAVSFYLLPAVLVYSLRLDGKTRQLDHTQTLQFDSEVWHINIDTVGHLWVVLQSHPHLAIYGHDTKQFIPLSMTNNEHHLLHILDTINGDAEFFKDATAEESLLNVLLNKRMFDAAKDPSYSKGNKRKDHARENEHSKAAKLPHVSS